jgi:hypothetical protein
LNELDTTAQNGLREKGVLKMSVKKKDGILLAAALWFISILMSEMNQVSSAIFLIAIIIYCYATIEDYLAVSLAQKFLIGIGVLTISFMTILGITPHGKASISREFNIVIVSLASISFGLYFSIKFARNLKIYFEIRHHKE